MRCYTTEKWAITYGLLTAYLGYNESKAYQLTESELEHAQIVLSACKCWKHLS